jgi:hypothetical protein
MKPWIQQAAISEARDGREVSRTLNTDPRRRNAMLLNKDQLLSKTIGLLKESGVRVGELASNNPETGEQSCGPNCR